MDDIEYIEEVVPTPENYYGYSCMMADESDHWYPFCGIKCHRYWCEEHYWPALDWGWITEDDAEFSIVGFRCDPYPRDYNGPRVDEGVDYSCEDRWLWIGVNWDD